MHTGGLYNHTHNHPALLELKENIAQDGNQISPLFSSNKRIPPRLLFIYFYILRVPKNNHMNVKQDFWPMSSAFN